MGRKGLEEEAILDEAAALIAEEGIEGFSLRGLARRLGVRSASLYNHVNSLDDLIARVARRAMDQMNEVLRRAVVDKKRTEAVQAFFCAYHAYAHDNPEMYQVVLSLPMMATDVAAQVVDPIQQVLAGYDLSSCQRVHCERFMRSVLHGFVSLEHQGYLSHFAPPAEESYRLAIESVCNMLEHTEELS